MEFGAATHFAQGWPTSLIESAVALGIDTVRDSIPWGHVERQRGVYDFSDIRASYVHAVAEAGLDVSLTFHPQHELYNSGETIHDPADIAAFADFVVATLTEFDGQVTRIEIGNEFNSNSFVSGAVADTRTAVERAEYYTAILKAVAEAVRPLFPEVEIAGGAMHSIPVGYAQALGASGAFEFMDVVVIHPYTLPPEQLPAVIALLDSVTGGLPIHATEFGQQFESLEDAPDYMAKMVAMMAASGVEAAHWYALYEQRWFENMELVDKEQVFTPAGESFHFIADTVLEGGEAVQLDAGPGTYLVTFGAHVLMAWGVPQSISLNGPVTVYNTQGHRLDDFDGTLSPDAPVIIISEAPLVLGDTVNLSGNTLIAHSAYDFDVDDRDGFAGPWSYFKVTSDDAVQTALITMAGGETRGEAWNPYLGNPGTRPLAVTAGAVVPVDFNNNSASPRNEFAILERFTASDDGFVTINAFWDVRDSSEDGVVVEISHNGDLLFSDQVFNPANGHVLEATLSGIGLSAGDTIDFRVGTGGNAVGGDRTERLYEIISETRVSPAADKTVVDIAPDARRVFGSDEDELIDGSGHANALRLYGKAGSDQLIGSAHNDVLIGGTGADALIGGDGDDVFAIDAADITVSGGEGHDRVRVNGTEGVHLILQEAAVEVVRGGAGDDHFDGTGVAAALRLYGEGGADRLIGGSGHDVLVGGLGADALIGGSGNDVLVIDGTDVTVMGGEGHDRVRVNGTDGVHLELHEAAVEVVQGGIGDDHLNGAGAAVGLRLHGGGGADTLQGGHAADTLIGGTGADTFVLSGSSARDRILDFGAGDTLLIASALAPTLADVEAAAEEVARGLHLQFNDASIMIVDAARDILSDSVFIV